MEYTFKANLKTEGRSISVIQKILLFTVAMLLMMTLSFWYNGSQRDSLVRQAVPEERIDKAGDSEMSAVKFTTLPFILAFKHFIVERDE